MKNIYRFVLPLVCMAFSFDIAAQKNVGIGTTQPDQSAVLDLQASDKGLLVPRMTLEQRNAILQPAKGLLVYQTDLLSGFYFYNGEGWKPLSDNEAKSVATGDINGWALDGNETTTGTKATATASSFIGTATNVPINFKIGGVRAGLITPDNNTIIRNLFLGLEAGRDNTPIAGTQGYENTAIGNRALTFNTTGFRNTALGYGALYKNIDGDYNMALGGLSLVFNENGSNNMAIGYGALQNARGSSNVGIGTNALLNLSSGNSNVAIGGDAGKQKTGSANLYIGYGAGSATGLTTENTKLYIANSSTTLPLIGGDFANGFIKINVKPQVNVTGGITSPTPSTTLGFLAIGDFSDANFSNLTKVPVTGNGYRLYVQDGVLTEKVKVALKSTADWADYVFEPEYQKNMLSLEQVEQFTKENKHLPNVPSADEMATQGLDVGRTSKMFMEKIEELTLYMIELNKEVKALKSENEALKAKLK